MRFLYTTDLHGDTSKYSSVLNYALENNIKLIHLGADLFPKNGELLTTQRLFIHNYLKEFYKKCTDNNIKVLAFFGNDDIYFNKNKFRMLGELLDEKKYILDDYEFSAYQYVQDYPFGLKAACKLDYDGWNCKEKYLSKPVDFDDYGTMYVIDDTKKYFDYKGTIEEDLQKIKGHSKLIMAIHQPPIGIDLDVCISGKRVGSKSVYEWIKREQPLLVVCGHIHECYKVTNVWKRYIDKTFVIQPGQDLYKTTIVDINIDELGVIDAIIGNI